MATVYVPRLIESAAQAEALPEGSIVINNDGDRYSRHPRWGEWHSVADDRDLTEDLDSTFRPPTITALVPVEAEESPSVDYEAMWWDAERRAEKAEAERDRWHSMWRQRGIKHLAAEKRATRAEAQADIRGCAVVVYRERAREAEQRERQGEATIRRQERTMTTIYVRHDVTTIAEVNALALDEDQRENGAIVLYEGSTCYWSINWATRNEIPGRWYDNSSDGLQLVDGDEVTVLVPIEAVEEHVAPDAITYSRYVTAWEEA